MLSKWIYPKQQVEAFGEVIVINDQQNNGIEVNRFETETAQQDAYYDNILYQSGKPYVIITQPDNYYLQCTPDLSVQAIADNLQVNWGIKFVLDIGTAYEQSIIDKTKPYEVTFTDLAKSEHVVDAFVIDDLGNEVAGTDTHDKKIQIGIGDYYVAIGDSITKGYGDDDPSDDISADGRNEGGGYEPILNNLLTAERGYPHNIVNEGVEGATSADGRFSISTILAEHPHALRFLVQYGTNDSDIWLPIPSGKGLHPGDPGYPGTFKDNMQQIIDAINAAGKEVCLAKVPIALADCSHCKPYEDPSQGQKNLLIQEYNEVIDELVGDPTNNISVTPPDFYSYFEVHYPDEYADWLHPNGIGYHSMAELWAEVLNQ
ncbi:MAG: hypothetical protein B5M53_02260 [Candidatus Cloacimonas sp. 4484_209]|nr:MAG: hypothetical protein B5M53_02260 [Candidatus Cloacimonas sp. 4484_209]